MTKEAQYSSEFISLLVVSNRSFDSYQLKTNCPVGYLTTAAPSCTLTVTFTPFMPGTDGGTIFSDEASSTQKPTATFTGTGTKPCRKKKQNAKTVQYKKKCKGFRRFIPRS